MNYPNNKINCKGNYNRSNDKNNNNTINIKYNVER